jgi:hypothetical protein
MVEQKQREVDATAKRGEEGMDEQEQREVEAAGKQYTYTVRASYHSGTKRAEETQQREAKEEAEEPRAKQEAEVEVEQPRAKEATEQDTDAERVPDQAVAKRGGQA